MKRFAMTLAEVLITLGIIGIVSAMTIPTLMQNFQQHAAIASLKKAYSTINQAVQLSESSNGDISSWNFQPGVSTTTIDSNFLNKYLIPYFKIAKSCGTASSYCFVQPKAPDGNLRLSTLYYNYLNSYILADGTSLAFYFAGAAFDGSGNPIIGSAIGIVVDINGMKPPNTLGKDVFAFVALQNAAPRYNGGLGDCAQNIKTGGVYPDGANMPSSTSYSWRGCGTDVTNPYAGFFCARDIIKNNWQTPAGYPW